MTGRDALPEHDRDVLRRLAARQVEIAESPLNVERRELWYKHDSGTGGRPMILAEEFGIMDEVSPLPQSDVECETPWARRVEERFRTLLYRFDILRDDHVVEPFFNINWRVQVSDYGVEIVERIGDNYGRMASRKWDPPVLDLDRDFDKLRPRTYSVDREVTLARKERLEGVFGDILPVRIRGSFWWTMGMTYAAIMLHGLDNLMISAIENPDGVHRLMAFLRDDHLRFAEWLEREGLLSLNDEDDYLGSGSIAYTHGLPQPDYSGRARMKDQWVLLESQETVGVGPRQFAELFFPYQLSIAEKFGKCYYGCCEPVHSRWHVIKQLPNLARISVSPWADEEFMAGALGRDYVYSRKPAPSMISTGVFNESAIRENIRHTLEVARGCRIELVMKDVHTLNNEPWRLPRWVEIAREEIEEMAG